MTCVRLVFALVAVMMIAGVPKDAARVTLNTCITATENRLKDIAKKHLEALGYT